MLRAATYLVCLLAVGGAAFADVAPDYPETMNRYRFELAAVDGFDAEGAHLVLLTKTLRRGDEPATATYTVTPVGEEPTQVKRWHWSEDVTFTLVLVRGDVPAKPTKAWLDSAETLAKLDMSGALRSRERANKDNADYYQQIYTMLVTPKQKGDGLALSAKPTKVVRQSKSGETLEQKELDGKEIGRRFAVPGQGLLGLGALLGLLGLGGLTLSRRRAA